MRNLSSPALVHPRVLLVLQYTIMHHVFSAYNSRSAVYRQTVRRPKGAEIPSVSTAVVGSPYVSFMRRFTKSAVCDILVDRSTRTYNRRNTKF